MQIRAGTVADPDTVLALMDDAVAWLVEQVRRAQTVSVEPFSGNEQRIAFIAMAALKIRP